MALPPLVPVADLETLLGVAVGSLSGVDLARAEANLRDASSLIRAEGKDWVDADGVTITAPEQVLTVARAAALRPYRNPDGFQGENVGDYGWQAAQGSVGVYLSDEEKRIIHEAASGGRKNTIGTVRTPSAMFDPLEGVTDPAAWWLL